MKHKYMLIIFILNTSIVFFFFSLPFSLTLLLLFFFQPVNQQVTNHDNVINYCLGIFMHCNKPCFCRTNVFNIPFVSSKKRLTVSKQMLIYIYIFPVSRVKLFLKNH